jgi:uncharacterized protein YndB with AHSA1/START domain
MTKTIKMATVTQSVVLPAPPARVFDAYTSGRAHGRIIGDSATFQRRVGGTFGAWGGAVHGVNLELARGRRIVQAWRTADFPAGHYSIVELALAPAGRGKTRLTLRHHGVPARMARAIAANWQACYWDSNSWSV